MNQIPLSALVFLLVATGSVAHAGLFSTPIANASFETPVTSGFEPGITAWASESSPGTFTQNEASAENMPITTAGVNWGGLTGDGAIYQQIGSFTANENLSVSWLAGDRSNKIWAGLAVQLWAGGVGIGEAGNADTLDGSTLASHGAVLIGSYPVPLVENAGIQTLAFSHDFSTGPETVDYRNGDPLWIRIAGEGSGGGPQGFIDDISVAISVNPPIPAAPLAQSIGIDPAGDMILYLENLAPDTTSIVQHSDDMATGSWSDRFSLAGMTRTGLLVPSGKPKSFYRVRTTGYPKVVAPNILLILAEDCNQHWYDLYDATHGTATPNISSLAASGLVFDNAFCHVAVCSAARSTLISGCDPNRIGVAWHRRTTPVRLSNGLLPFPAYLKKAGYYTSNSTVTDYNLVVENAWDNAASSEFGWRDRPGAETPFFHVRTIYTSHESSIRLANSIANPITNPATLNLYPIHPDTPNFRDTYATYFDMIKSVDSDVGRLVNALQADGLLDDTFIIFAGDNGGAVAGSKGYIVNTGLHVPLVVRVPANWSHLAPVSPDGRVAGFVGFEDIGPSIMRLAGLGLPKEMDGKPFLGEGITLAQVNESQTVFSSSDRFDEMYNLIRSIQTGNLKYIRHFQPYQPYALYNVYRYGMVAQAEWKMMHDNNQLNATQIRFFEARRGEELYDLASDPFETHNLAGDPAYATSLASLRSGLHQRITRMPDVGIIPEPVFLRENGHLDPVNYGRANQQRIERYVAIADLMLDTYVAVRTQLQTHLASADPLDRYWALTACAAFGSEASDMQSTVAALISTETDPLVLARAAVFLGESGMAEAVVEGALKAGVLGCADKTDSLLVLNDATHLQDTLGYRFNTITSSNIVGASTWLTNRITHLGW
jgi:arylsulfatase A-like enzyme